MTHTFEVFELEHVPVLFWIHFPFAVLQTHSFMLLAFLHHAIHTREASWPNPILISHVMKNCNLFKFLGAHYIAISDDGEMNPPSVVAASQASLLSSWESLRRSPRKEHWPNVDDALLSVKSSALKLDAVAQVMWRSLWLFTLDSEQEMFQAFLCSHPEDMFTFVFLLQPWYIRKEQDCKTTAKNYLTLKKKKEGIRRMRGSSRKRKWEGKWHPRKEFTHT